MQHKLSRQSLSNSSQMVSSSLHNISRFKWNYSTIGVSNQRSKGKTIRKTSIAIGTKGIGVTTIKNLGISITLLATMETKIWVSRNSGDSSGVYIGSTF